MERTLSWQRLFLSTDADDWVWARWMRPRPGATPLDIVSAYCHMIWETDIPHPDPQPGLPLEGGRWAPERVSPFPGVHRVGKDAYWLDGVPVAEREPVPAESHCGVMTFWSDWSARVQPSSDFVTDAVLDMTGGGEGGGPTSMAVACLLWYGACVEMEGGGEGGGPMEVIRGTALDMSGGAEGGGPVVVDEATTLDMAGGAEGGGPVAVDEGLAVEMLGGGEGGGPMDVDTGFAFPTFNGATGPTISVTGTLTLDVPAGISDGDMMVAVACIVGDWSTWGLPAGWTTIQSANLGALNGGYVVGWKTWNTGDPMTVAITFTSGSAVGGVTAVTGATLPATGPAAFGSGSVMDPGTLIVPIGPAIGLWWGFTAGGSTTDDPPAGWATADAGMPGTPMVEYYIEDDPAGTYPGLDSDIVSDDWVAFAISIS